jgi:hypothetical protein
MPAFRQLPAPEAAATEQSPSVFPAAMVQTPPQHSAAVLQTSPVCAQNEGFVQIPLLQKLDAQPAFVVHGLPDVAGPAPLSGVQVPPPAPFGAHLPPQHSGSVAHARLSATHCLVEHVPPMHEKVQHSFPVTHATPDALHALTGAVHWCVVALQFALQQSPLVAHVCATGLQSAASARPPSVMALMKPSAASPASDGSTLVSGEPVASLSPASLAEAPSSPLSVASVMAGVSSLPQPVNTRFITATAPISPRTATGALRIRTSNVARVDSRPAQVFHAFRSRNSNHSMNGRERASRSFVTVAAVR